MEYKESYISVGVYHKCQCPLFKQFTTRVVLHLMLLRVFIISVNVLFLSNSQQETEFRNLEEGCLS